MRPLAWAVGLTVLGSLGGVLVASALLIFNNSLRDRLVPWLVSHAAGTLLGVALVDRLPEAPAHLPARTVPGWLTGLMLQLLRAGAGIGTVVVMSSLIGGN